MVYHFSKLLAKNVDSDSNNNYQAIIDSDIDLFRTELDQPFSKTELLLGLKGLKITKQIPLTKFPMKC